MCFQKMKVRLRARQLATIPVSTESCGVHGHRLYTWDAERTGPCRRSLLPWQLRKSRMFWVPLRRALPFRVNCCPYGATNKATYGNTLRHPGFYSLRLLSGCYVARKNISNGLSSHCKSTIQTNMQGNLTLGMRSHLLLRKHADSQARTRLRATSNGSQSGGKKQCRRSRWVATTSLRCSSLVGL